METEKWEVQCTSYRVFSVDRLGYESLKPEQETVVWEFLGGKNVFAPCLRAMANRCVHLFSARFSPFLASETSAEHTDRAACIDRCFRMSH